ncbi:MAG: hypothetical protein SGI92_18435 [Bryobacteraceae bacterium]|nr:hypothetical protein [Bryobacteraceae bacterium]
MAQGADEFYFRDGRVYVPFHTARLAAGPFLSLSPDWVEQYLELPPELHHGVLDRYVGGVGMPRTRLAAAQVHGDSMICRDVLHGDIVLFQRVENDYSGNGKIVVIEKMGEEEGLGAWALKKLVVERRRSSRQSEYEDEIDWDDPVVVLRSYNPHVSPARLDPDGRYRVHGIFLRSLRGQDVSFVDANAIRRFVSGEP